MSELVMSILLYAAAAILTLTGMVTRLLARGAA